MHHVLPAKIERPENYKLTNSCYSYDDQFWVIVDNNNLIKAENIKNCYLITNSLDFYSSRLNIESPLVVGIVIGHVGINDNDDNDDSDVVPDHDDAHLPGAAVLRADRRRRRLRRQEARRLERLKEGSSGSKRNGQN